MRLLPLIAIGVFVAGAARPQGRTTAACNRECLEDLVNQYFEAMVARNPHSLPIAPNIKFSQNDQLIPFGDGLWHTATGIGTYKLYVADPQGGQVGFLRTMRENGRPIALALRLKIENRKISEVETLVLRDGMWGRPSACGGLPGRLRDIPTERPAGLRAPRTPRACPTTNNPKSPARRHAMIDEERGIVFGFYMAHINGTVTTINSPRGKIKVDPQNASPVFIHTAETFKFRTGKVRRVQTLQIRLPYGTPDPFFSQDWRRGRK